MDSVAIVGRQAPDFRLFDLEGEPFELAKQRGKVVVLNFWSAECPWSQRSDERLGERDNGWHGREDILFLRIASNATEEREELRRVAETREVGRVLRDPEQQVADLYGAMTTPHVFVIDAEGILRYKGAPDDSSWREPEPSRNYLAEAVAAAIGGKSATPSETPGRGCTIVRYGVKES